MTLITGCLGSGKTTLLQRLLGHPALSDTAVLINEFGEIGLDHHLLERIDETMVMLQSGCVCCTIRGELSAAIKDVHSRRERGLLPTFRRLVIESTGLADPFPILSTVRSDPVAPSGQVERLKRESRAGTTSRMSGQKVSTTFRNGRSSPPCGRNRSSGLRTVGDGKSLVDGI